MSIYSTMSAEELQQVHQELVTHYELCKSKDIKLDMTRGKPCQAQLDLSMDMLNITSYLSIDGDDCRNYGILGGIKEIKSIFAQLLEIDCKNIIIGGNSSLALMHDTMANAMLVGVGEGCTPWGKQGRIKFLCPVPGYDRHFAITEKFGIEMIPVSMNEHGPDMDTIEKLVSSDSSIKGIWCVPKYSNPSGVVYSDETVRRFAALKPAAKDFRIFWDNAYLVHDFGKQTIHLLNIFEACEEHGSADMVYEFTSTSKVTFSGAGIACFASSERNCKWQSKQMSVQIIGYDKLNQLRHAEFLRDSNGVYAHMKKHAAIMAPKFDTVQMILERELGGLGISTWTKPQGGYFISYNQPECAKRITELAKEAGLSVTPAGSTYPYGIDPEDGNLRIAPSLPSIDELKQAAELFCVCAKLAYVEKMCVKL